MTNETIKRQQAGLALVSGFAWGWVAMGLVLPFAAIAVSPILIALLIATLILIFRVAGRPDAAYVSVGVLIGVVLSIISPTISIVSLVDGSKLLIASVLILLSYHV